MNTQMMRAAISKLSLPDDPVRQAQLREKLREYLFRLKMPLYDPTETSYKVAVLGRLLDDGGVDPVALAAELAADPARPFDHAMFHDAFAVIQGYCRNGGDTLIGGTGLRAPG